MNDMNWIANVSVVFPQIVLLLAACAIAIIDLFVTDPRRTVTHVLTMASLAVVAALQFGDFSAGVSAVGLNGMVVSDPMGNLLSFFATVAVMITLVYARPYAGEREMLKGELFTLAMLSLLGIHVMIAGHNFLTIYLGLELLSLSLYALAALRRDHVSATEAAMKYFVLGALASGFLLYGMSMIYGATGSLDLDEVFQAVSTGTLNREVLMFGVVFLVAGLAFKIGAVPFHMWVPDVYQGAPTAVTLLIGGAPELAGFAIIVRLLVEGLLGLAVDWQQMLMVLAVASLVIGNVAAIAQTNLKRMLAYSTIAQMGFMLLGMTAGVVQGNTLSATNAYSSAMYYAVTYVLTTLGSFGIIMLLARAGHEAEQLDDLKGLARRSPWYAAVMAIFMFSLAGLPPAVGFFAKLAVLQALVSTNVDAYVYLAVFAVMASLIGAFYYLRVVKVMYFDEPQDSTPLRTNFDVRAVLSLNGLAVLGLGLLPNVLMAWCESALSRTLAL